MEVKHIIRFSGGKDSTAMLFKMIEKKMPIDYIIFTDTGAEFPETYRHIQEVNRRIAKYGLKIIKIPMDYTLEEFMTIYKRKYGVAKGHPYTFPTPKLRWCTEYKAKSARKFQRELEKQGYLVKVYIGYSADEQKRFEVIKTRETKQRKFIALLIDWGMTEKDSLEYCYSLGFDWDGLYKHIDRVSCFLCPLTNKKGVEYLCKQRPELWARIKRLEQHMRERGDKHWQWKMGKSTDDIERELGCR